MIDALTIIENVQLSSSAFPVRDGQVVWSKKGISGSFSLEYIDLTPHQVIPGEQS